MKFNFKNTSQKIATSQSSMTIWGRRNVRWCRKRPCPRRRITVSGTLACLRIEISQNKNTSGLSNTTRAICTITFQQRFQMHFEDWQTKILLPAVARFPVFKLTQAYVEAHGESSCWKDCICTRYLRDWIWRLRKNVNLINISTNISKRKNFRYFRLDIQFVQHVYVCVWCREPDLWSFT